MVVAYKGGNNFDYHKIKPKLKINNKLEITYNNNFNFISQNNNEDAFTYFQLDKNIYNVDPFLIQARIEELKKITKTELKIIFYIIR